MRSRLRFPIPSNLETNFFISLLRTVVSQQFDFEINARHFIYFNTKLFIADFLSKFLMAFSLYIQKLELKLEVYRNNRLIKIKLWIRDERKNLVTDIYE